MLWWFAQTTLIAGGLAVVAILAGRWKRLGPEARHALWLVVLIKLAIPPFVAWPWGLADAWPTRVEVAPTLVMDSAPVQAPAPAPVEARAPTVEISEPSPASRSLPTNPFEDAVEMLLDADIVEPPPMIREPAAVPELATGIESESLLPRTREALSKLPEHHRAPWSVVIDHGSSALLGLWLAGSIVVVTRRAIKVVRFHRSLADSRSAPAWLVEEARAIGERVGVRPPPIVATSGVGTPLLWCLGAPRLILPEALIKRLEADRWPGILAHELAHLARRDHWVVRLELLVEAVWWWNPLFWLTRRRLHVEAEQACDARVVRSWPERRFAYAEALVDVCEHLARTAIPSPSLGVGGAGASRSLEGRLLMILRDPIPRRPSRRAALAATLLAALALPAWTLGQQPDAPKPQDAPKAEVRPKPEPSPKPDPARPRPEPTPLQPRSCRPAINSSSGWSYQVRISRSRRSRKASRSGGSRSRTWRCDTSSPADPSRRGIRPDNVASRSRRPTSSMNSTGSVMRANKLPSPTSAHGSMCSRRSPNRQKPVEAVPAVPWARWLVIRNGEDIKSLRVDSAGKGPAQFRWGAVEGQSMGNLTLGMFLTRDSTLLSGDVAASVPTINTPDLRPLVALDLEGPSPSIIAAQTARANVAGVETIDGREAVRIAWVSQKADARGICWLAPSLDFAVVRSDAFIDGPRDSSKPNTRWVWRKVSGDFTKVGDLWLPGKVTTRLTEVEFDGKTTVVREQVVTLEDYRVNAELPKKAFQVDFPIQAIDEKTGDFTTTPPEPSPGLIARLNRAVRESPFGPPVDEKTTLDLKVVATSQPGQPQLPPTLSVQAVPPGADAAKVDPGIIARPNPGFADPIPTVEPKKDDLIPVKPPAVDPEFERQFKADPEIVNLESMISAARKKLTEVQRIARSAKDPAIVAAQNKLDSLTKEYNQLREAKLQEFRNNPPEAVVQARTNLEVLQARRDGKAAELLKAQAQRDLAGAVVQRNERLRKQNPNLVSREEVDKAEAELKVAEAEVAGKKAEVREADAILNQARQRLEAAKTPNPVPKAESPRAGDETGLFQSRRDAKAAELQKAEAQRDIARLEFQNTERLWKQKSVSRGELDLYEGKVKVAEAEVAGKKAELAEADLLLNQARQHLGAASAPNPAVNSDQADPLQARRKDKAAEVEKARERLEQAKAAVASLHERAKNTDFSKEEILIRQKAVTAAEADLASKRAEPRRGSTSS